MLFNTKLRFMFCMAGVFVIVAAAAVVAIANATVAWFKQLEKSKTCKSVVSSMCSNGIECAYAVDVDVVVNCVWKTSALYNQSTDFSSQNQQQYKEFARAGTLTPFRAYKINDDIFLFFGCDWADE